jgi:hypothetical protein
MNSCLVGKLVDFGEPGEFREFGEFSEEDQVLPVLELPLVNFENFDPVVES